MIYFRILVTVSVFVGLVWLARFVAARRVDVFEENNDLKKSIYWDDVGEWLDWIYWPALLVVGAGWLAMGMALLWGWRP